MTEASFDTLGRIRSESFGNDGSGNTLWPVTSGYNTTGQRTHLTYPAHGTWPAKRLKYTWDDYGRLSAVVDLDADGVTEVETIASYAYSMGSRLVQTTRADNSKWSAPTATAWDKAGRRTGAQVIGTTNAVLFEEKLIFDKNDRVTRIEWPKGRLNETETEAQIYSYDELSRLTNFDQGLLAGTAITTVTSAHEWKLDELGNWRQHRDKRTNVNNPLVDVAVDPVNAYSAWPLDLNIDGTVQTTETASLNYDDARGFLVKQPDSATTVWKYWHDGFGRLSQVDRCSNITCTGTPSWSVTYRYTADGRMATRTKNAEAATWYLYDGSQVIAEQTPAERSTWYVWSGSSLLQSARVLVAGGSVDKLNLHQDWIGNVVLATRLNGSAIELWGRLQFDPYGRKVSNITWEVNGVHVPYRFVGQRLDPDTGLYLMGARWYSAELGRFIEQDPIAEGGGLNLYAYTGSSPTLWVDPSGLRADDLELHAPSAGSLAPWARGEGGGTSFSTTKVVMDGVNTVDPLTGQAFAGMVEGFMAVGQMAQEAGDWSATKAILGAIAAATVDGKPAELSAAVMVEAGAVVVDLYDSSGGVVRTGPPANQGEVKTTKFGDAFGGVEVEGDLKFLGKMIQDMGTIMRTISGRALLDNLAAAPGATVVSEGTGDNSTLWKQSTGIAEIEINPGVTVNGGTTATNLFHEFTHAMHNRMGTRAPGDSDMLYSSAAAQTTGMKYAPNAELQTIGLGHWQGDLITENTFRAELSLTLRTNHELDSGTTMNWRNPVRIHETLTVRPK